MPQQFCVQKSQHSIFKDLSNHINITFKNLWYYGITFNMIFNNFSLTKNVSKQTITKKKSKKKIQNTNCNFQIIVKKNIQKKKSISRQVLNFKTFYDVKKEKKTCEKKAIKINAFNSTCVSF